MTGPERLSADVRRGSVQVGAWRAVPCERTRRLFATASSDQSPPPATSCSFLHHESLPPHEVVEAVTDVPGSVGNRDVALTNGRRVGAEILRE